MQSTHPSSSATSIGKEDKIRHFPPETRAAYLRFCSTGDVDGLDPVILAILSDFIPNKSAQPLAALTGSTRLMEDLGFDSLSLTEVVFLTEELFGISIANAEIVQVRTLDDLRHFVRTKLSKRAA